jgi:transcription elongation GreA/GreB family factor
MKLYLQAHFNLLKTKIVETEKRLVEAGKEIGEAVNQSSETWHDNAPFEVARDNVKLIDRQLQSLMSLVQDARIVNVNESNEVAIGSLVETKNQFEVKGHSEWYLIGSYWVPNNTENSGSFEDPILMSYHSPLAKVMLGKKAGDKVTFGKICLIIEQVKPISQN